MKIICDTDIISSLAKIDKINLLREIFRDLEILIPIGVYEELERARELGYDFPLKVFDSTKTVSMMNDELELYQKKMSENRDLDKGELQGLMIAQNRGLKFLTNDNVAREEAKNRGIKTYNLAEIIRAAYLDDKLSEQGVKELIKNLKEKDHFSFANESDLYE